MAEELSFLVRDTSRIPSMMMRRRRNHTEDSNNGNNKAVENNDDDKDGDNSKYDESKRWKARIRSQSRNIPLWGCSGLILCVALFGTDLVFKELRQTPRPRAICSLLIPPVTPPMEPPPRDDMPDYAGIVDPEEELGSAREIEYDEDDLLELQHGMRMEEIHAWQRTFSGRPLPPHLRDDWDEDEHTDHELYHAHYDVKRVFRPPNGHNKDACLPMPWSENVRPTCNGLHEFNLDTAYRQSQFLGGGFFRRVFMAHDNGNREKVVLKVAGLGLNLPLEDKSAWDSCHNEAVVSEQLSHNPHIVELYSYCGLSMLSQAMERGDLHGVAAPKYERCQENLPADQWELRNNLTAHHKVQYALEMAQAVQVLHKHAVVHNDLQVSQFLLSADNHIKLTDFNRATVLQWSQTNPTRSCQYSYYKTPGSSPEEYVVGGPLDEKIDIYNLASNFYVLLTGVEPYFDTCEDYQVQRLVTLGTLPKIDERWRRRSRVENSLADLMTNMWTFEAQKRPTIHQVVERLQEIATESMSNS